MFIEFTRHLGRLTGGCLGMALCVALAWSAVLTVEQKLAEVSGGESAFVFTLTGVLFGAVVLAGIGRLAKWVTKNLQPVLGAWLCVAAWGHPGEGPAPARLAAHALFAVAGVAVGVLVYGEGLAQRETAWSVLGLLLVGAGVVFGVLGGLPWVLGLRRSGQADVALLSAAQEQGGTLLAALSVSVGAAMGLMEVVT